MPCRHCRFFVMSPFLGGYRMMPPRSIASALDPPLSSSKHDLATPQLLMMKWYYCTDRHTLSTTLPPSQPNRPSPLGAKLFSHYRTLCPSPPSPSSLFVVTVSTPSLPPTNRQNEPRTLSSLPFLPSSFWQDRKEARSPALSPNPSPSLARPPYLAGRSHSGVANVATQSSCGDETLQ